jgi:cytochrome c peroxidase
MSKFSSVLVLAMAAFLGVVVNAVPPAPGGVKPDGQRLFERETFGGNGRTCRTCHSKETGTISPKDARQRLRQDPNDPLFLLDGSDDGAGNGVTRMLADATILMHIKVASNMTVDGTDSAIVPRGIPTTINTPALDPVLMLDGRQPSLQAQADGAIHDHAQAIISPTAAELDAIKAFELTDRFFSTPMLERFFSQGSPVPGLPEGRTASEKRGRRFMEDVEDLDDPKHGLCAGCHAGPMLNETNLATFHAFAIPVGTRFQDILVSTLNVAGNPMHHYVFNPGPNQEEIDSPDIGRAAITGVAPSQDGFFDHVNAFKIPQLRGVRNTAPYFHDNSAKTLDDVLQHYATFFDIVTGGGITLTPQDRRDIVAYLKLLD